MEYDTSLTHDENLYLITEQDKKWVSYLGKEVTYQEAQEIYRKLKYSNQDFSTINQIKQIEDVFPNIKVWFNSQPKLPNFNVTVEKCVNVPKNSTAYKMGYWCKDGKWYRTVKDKTIEVSKPLPEMLNPKPEESDVQKLQKKYLDFYYKRLSIPNGIKVPEGFSPFNYEEYLSLANTIIKKCPELKKYLTEPMNCSVEDLKSNGETTISQTSEKDYFTTPTTDRISSTDEMCWKSLCRIQSSYYNEKFPKGITKDDISEFNKKRKDIENKIKDFEDRWALKIEGGFGKKFDYDQLYPIDKKKYDDLQKELEDLQLYYGFDGRTSVDKFMDSELGQIIQYGAPIALMIAGFFTEGATWITAADILLNLSLGTYHLQRGNTSEALIFFLFAGLTELKELYNYVKIRAAGQVLDYGKITKSLLSKMKGVRLNSMVEIKSFESTLTPNERFVFRTVLSAPRNIITKDLESLAQKVAKNTGKVKNSPLTWEEAKVKVMSGASKFTKEIAGVTGVIYSIHSIYDKIKEICKERGVDITWGEKDNEILNKIKSGMTGVEIDMFIKKLVEIMKSLTKEENETLINKTLAENTLEEAKKIKDKEIQESINDAKNKYKEMSQKRESTIKNIELNRDSTINVFNQFLNQKLKTPQDTLNTNIKK